MQFMLNGVLEEQIDRALEEVEDEPLFDDEESDADEEEFEDEFEDDEFDDEDDYLDDGDEDDDFV